MTQNKSPLSYPWMWCLYRMTVMLGGTAVCLTSLYFGYELVRQGASGDFTISAETEGVKGFFTSVSPGLAFAFFGCIVAIVSYRLQKTSWGVVRSSNAPKDKETCQSAATSHTSPTQPAPSEDTVGQRNASG